MIRSAIQILNIRARAPPSELFTGCERIHLAPHPMLDRRRSGGVDGY
jgi:hypothetical protein